MVSSQLQMDVGHLQFAESCQPARLPGPIKYVPQSCPLQRRQIADRHVSGPVARMRYVCDELGSRALPAPGFPRVPDELVRVDFVRFGDNRHRPMAIVPASETSLSI